MRTAIIEESMVHECTAIPYRASTGPEQGFPCVLLPHREKPAFITGVPVDINRFFPVVKSTQRKPCFHYRDALAVLSNFMKISLEIVKEEFGL